MSAQLKEGYKQSEAGVIPEDWCSGTLGQFIALRRGHDLTHRDRRKGTVPVMGSAGQNGFHNVALAAGPGVTLGRSGASYGQAHFCNVDYWPHNTALYVTDFKGSDALFIFYFLKNIDFSSHNTGGAQQSLNRNFIYPIPVALPSIGEQKKISNAISDMDALISSLDQLIAKKRDIQQATMQQLLTGQHRLPGFSGELEVKRLGDLCKLGMGRTPSRINSAYWGSGYKWLSIANLKGKVVSESSEQVTELAAKQMSLIPKGTLLMSFKLSIGRLAFAGCDLFTNEAICSFNDLRANAEYLYYALQRVDFSLYGKQAVKGFTLNKASLQLVEVAIPTMEEQAAIAAILSEMDTELTTLEARRDKALLIKQGMMQELLTGRIRLA